MPSKDLTGIVSSVQSLAPAATAASRSGAGVDLINYEGALIQFDVGAWTDGVHTGVVEESDDDATYAAVAADKLQGALPVIDGSSDDEQVYEIGYIGSKRYIRAGYAVTGATIGAILGADVVRGYARVNPV